MSLLTALATAAGLLAAQTDVLTAFRAFPLVPQDVLGVCEKITEDGVVGGGPFVLLRCNALGASYSYDAGRVLNYMQVMRVPGVQSETECLEFVRKIVDGTAPDWSEQNDKSGKSRSHHFTARGNEYLVRWAVSRAAGKRCNLFACNPKAGVNALGHLTMCASTKRP